MPYAEFDDFKLHYADYPARETDPQRVPIVMMHGFTLDHRMWVGDAEYFSQWYRVILPDFKGHGLSDAPVTGYSRAHRIEDMVGLLDRLGIKKAHLAGLSMGGTTALGIALKYFERVTSLTLVSTSVAGFDPGPKIRKIDEIARTQNVDVARKRWISATLRYFGSDKKHIRHLLELMMREHSGAFWKDPMRGKYPAVDDLKHVHEVNLPTMILAGERDLPFVPLAKTLHEKISGSKLSILPSVGHMLNLEAPNEFRGELKLFLEDL
ncbi:MAG: alpha/beta hydrolase [Candidatus Zixiibacteriota bacterium]|nr:MAG: alpha/beta hydrolase [candidate division Zixibacteria bacterium]